VKFTMDFNDGLGEVGASYHQNGGGIVADTATVCRGAYVDAGCKVYGNAYVDDTCEIYGNASVYGNCVLKKYAVIDDNVEVFGTAMVEGVTIHGDSKVSTTPTVLLGFDHPIVITDDHVILGCQSMKFDYWKDHGKAIIKVNGYPTKTSQRIHDVVDELKELRISLYHQDEVQEALDMSENT